LREGNVDLASKYFVVEKQEEWRGELTKKRQGNDFGAWIDKLNTIQKEETPIITSDKSYYFYNYFNSEFGEIISSPIVFTMNKYTNIWKISVL